MLFGQPGFDFEDPVRVPLQVNFNSPLLFDCPPFLSPASPLRLHPHTAQILDEMRTVHRVVADLSDDATDEEEAAVSLGASGLRTFWSVTAPNIRWGLLYGVLLCNARAMGEFGAVSVVSGHIRGLTNTMPLHVEILYNEYDFVGAFAVAALLCALAIVTLALKTLLEMVQPQSRPARH